MRRSSRPGTPAFLALCAALLLPHPAVAALPCGPKPEVPEADAPKLTHDAEAKTEEIRHTPEAKQRALVTAIRHELRDKYAEVDNAIVDHYLLWVTCQTISNDPILVPPQKFDEYAMLYRLMSEKIASGAPHKE